MIAYHYACLLVVRNCSNANYFHLYFQVFTDWSARLCCHGDSPRATGDISQSDSDLNNYSYADIHINIPNAFILSLQSAFQILYKHVLYKSMYQREALCL